MKPLAITFTEASKVIGQKIDIYGSDACLMAMVEIANQVSDAVSVYLGSEETEPGDGWPYDALLAGWNKLSKGAPASSVASVLTQEYANYYKPKSSNVTLSAYDLNFLAPYTQSIKKFSTSFKKLSAADLKKVNQAAKASTHFAYEDYVDFGDFLNQVKSLKLSKLDKSAISDINENAKKFIVSNNTVGFPKAQGASIWIPTDASTYSEYADRYSRMNFDRDTQWGDVAKLIATAQ